jgi:hypothetical protein
MMNTPQNPILLLAGFLLYACFMAGCHKDVATQPEVDPDIYLDFEQAAEPFEHMPERSVDPDAHSNGCLSGVTWNHYYRFDVCIATTCEVTDYAIERSNQVARSGNFSLRFYLKPTQTDKWPLGEATHRAELGPHPGSPVERYPRQGEERWYGMSIFFPEDFVFAPAGMENELRFSIAQWQHGSFGSPAVALEVHGDKIALARSSGLSTQSDWIPPEFISRIQKGVWMDLVLQINWDKENGLINVWVDGQHRYEKKGIQTMYWNLDVGGGYKIGLYYWRWQYRESVVKSLQAGINYREIFIDEVREYLGEDGLSAVTPGNPF